GAAEAEKAPPSPRAPTSESAAGTQPQQALLGVDHVAEVVQVAQADDAVERWHHRVVDHRLHVADAVAAQMEGPDGDHRRTHQAVRGGERRLLRARLEPQAARDALVDHAVAGAGVEEEEAVHAAIERGADEPAPAVALERDLAPVGAGGSRD